MPRNQARVAAAAIAGETEAAHDAVRCFWLAGFRTRRELRLLDLTVPWCTRIGASTAINSGMRARAQRWPKPSTLPSRRLTASPTLVHERPSKAYALYERCHAALPATPSEHLSLDVAALELPLDRTARDLGYQIV